MNIKEIQKQALKVARENNFQVKKEIYRGIYYQKDNVRNIIYSGKYKNKEAILKFYDDPRLSYEPILQKEFLKQNKSKKLTAPKLYKSKMISVKRGWLIMEKIPNDFSNFQSPITPNERAEFLSLYLEYRKNFPKKPFRDLLPIEKLSAKIFHLTRISNWFRLAQEQEAKQMTKKNKVYLDKTFFALYEKALEKISAHFQNRKMIWCHGHFKPNEIFTNKTRDKYYLTDFAHSAMFPEAYELAFIIWADYLMMSEKWNLSFDKWKKGVYEWLDEAEKIAKKLKIKNSKQSLKIALIERVLGTILVDITASDRPDKEKRKGLFLMKKLLSELLK